MLFAWVGIHGPSQKHAILIYGVAPWIVAAIVRAFPGIYTVSVASVRDNPRLSLCGPWAVGLALAWTERTYVALIHPGSAILLGAAVGLALFTVAAIFDPILRHPKVRSFSILMFVLSVAYGYILVAKVNVMFDTSQPRVQQAVIRKMTDPLRGSPNLTLEPWGDEQEEQTIDVPYNRVYRLVHERGVACIVEYKGRLGFGWYTAQACPWNGNQVMLGPEPFNIQPQ